MTAISSHRPHNMSESYRINQIRAHDSWERYFKRIIYFGQEERELNGSTTIFIKSNEFPSIKVMAEKAAWEKDVVALINSDIVVSKNIQTMASLIRVGKFHGAISRRYHYDPDTFDLSTARDDPKDRGRDIFMAMPNVWRMIANKIPSAYRIGHQKWDAWVSDFFRDTFKSRFIDFTHMRCIFHPIHGDRRMPHAKEIEAL